MKWLNPSSSIPNYPVAEARLLAGDSFTAVNVGRMLNSDWTTKCKDRPAPDQTTKRYPGSSFWYSIRTSCTA